MVVKMVSLHFNGGFYNFMTMGAFSENAGFPPASRSQVHEAVSQLEAQRGRGWMQGER